MATRYIHGITWEQMHTALETRTNSAHDPFNYCEYAEVGAKRHLTEEEIKEARAQLSLTTFTLAGRCIKVTGGGTVQQLGQRLEEAGLIGFHISSSEFVDDEKTWGGEREGAGRPAAKRYADANSWISLQPLYWQYRITYRTAPEAQSEAQKIQKVLGIPTRVQAINWFKDGHVAGDVYGIYTQDNPLAHI